MSGADLGSNLNVRVFKTYDKGSGSMVADFRNEWTSLVYSTALHGGFHICRLTVPRDLAMGWLALQREGQQGWHFYHVEVEEGGDVRWEGRISRPGIRWGGQDELVLTALGYWSSCRDQRITTLTYNATTADVVIETMLTAKCPDINSDQSNIDSVPGAITLTVPADKYLQDHVIESIAPLGDNTGAVYHAAVWEDRKFWYTKRDITRVEWEVRLAASRGEIEQAAEQLRFRADAYDGTTRTSEATEAGYSNVYPIRDAVVRPAGSGYTNAALEAARDRFIAERKDPIQTGGFEVFGELVQSSGSYPVVGGNPRSGIRAGQVIRITDLIPGAAASPTLDNLRTFHIVSTEYNAGRDTVRIIPDKQPDTLGVLLARQGIEAQR